MREGEKIQIDGNFITYPRNTYFQRAIYDSVSPAVEEKGLALDEECNVDPPCADRSQHSDLIFVPNCNAGGPNEYLIGERVIERKCRW